jgi:hypothetical protein
VQRLDATRPIGVASIPWSTQIASPGIGEGADLELAPMHEGAVAAAQIVVDDWPEAGWRQSFAGMAADVPGISRHRDRRHPRITDRQSSPGSPASYLAGAQATRAAAVPMSS